MRLRVPLRPVLAVGIATAIVGLPLPATATDSGAAIVPKKSKKPSTTKKKAKKKRARQGRSAPKQEKTTGTVSASWSVTRSGELRNGIESETVTVKVKDGKVTFPDATGSTAQGTADVTILYEAKFSTDDRSWHAGCDREERTSTATFHETHPIYVYGTTRRTVGGKEQRLANGWGVEVAWLGIRKMGLVTTGYFQDWETILMQNCLTTPISEPLGHWGPQFVATLGVTGSLNGGGRGVLLTQAQSGSEQTGKADGRISFSASVEKR
ncbi:MAG: hypothetical protein WC558_05615 [Patulibacter sp.]